jgi:hypothetical protein
MAETNLTCSKCGCPTDLLAAFLEWDRAARALDAVNTRLDAMLPPEGDERVAALDALIETAGGRITPLGATINLYAVRQRIIARRLAAQCTEG